MARELGLSEDRVSRVRLAGLLHDIGKATIPDSILKKPGLLDPVERRSINTHPAIGAQIIDHHSLGDVRAWVAAHHERHDGNGYPSGLAGHKIPVEARILAVADAYEAMTSDRAYRAAVTPAEACAELLRCANSQFDPTVVNALLNALARAPHEQTAGGSDPDSATQMTEPDTISPRSAHARPSAPPTSTRAAVARVHEEIRESYPAVPGSIPDARSAVTQLATRSGIAGEPLEAIRLAVTEAVTNAVKHAYTEQIGAFHVTAAVTGEELWVLVADDGSGYKTRARSPGLGWGLALIAQHSEEYVITERADGGTEVRMRFAIPPSTEPAAG
jgi:anti-sigma regulatory factor (Ser/Thr protein kinase)